MFVSPTRGYQKPKMRNVGINHWALVHFLEDAKHACERYEYKENALMFEMLEKYFRDYDPSKPLKFNSRIIGL